MRSFFPLTIKVVLLVFANNARSLQASSARFRPQFSLSVTVSATDHHLSIITGLFGHPAVEDVAPARKLKYLRSVSMGGSGNLYWVSHCVGLVGRWGSRPELSGVLAWLGCAIGSVSIKCILASQHLTLKFPSPRDDDCDMSCQSNCLDFSTQRITSQRPRNITVNACK